VWQLEDVNIVPVVVVMAMMAVSGPNYGIGVLITFKRNHDAH